eukprot:1490298-Prorocentrum_lima.AAC.1
MEQLNIWLTERSATRRWMPISGQEWLLLRLAPHFTASLAVLRLLAGGLFPPSSPPDLRHAHTPLVTCS